MTRLMLLLFVVLLALLMGCAGNVSTPTPTEDTVTREQLLTGGLVYRTVDADWVRTEEVEGLVEAARSEGEVHITTYNQEQVDAWCTAFTAEFGIACEGRGIWGAQVVATLITEQEAREAITDVVHLSMSQAQQVLDRGYMARVDWEALGVDPRRVWKSQNEGNAVGATQSQYTHFYNTNVFSEEDLPQTLQEWLDPKYKRKVCSPDFLLRAGSGFAALYLGLEETVGLARQLTEENEMVVTTTCDPLIVSGEKPLMFMGYGNPPALLEGNPIGQFWNPGLGVNLFSNMVAGNAPHPNAARLFAAWATSREASRLSYEAIGQGWAAYGHGPEGLVTGQFADIDLVYESPWNFVQRGENTRLFQDQLFGSGG